MLNEILGTAARFNQLLTRKFNITGGAPAPQLTPEIGASYSMDRNPEDLILGSEVLASGFMTVTGAAGQSGAISLGNNTSGIVVVLEQIRIIPAAALVNGIIVSLVNTSGLPTSPGAGDVCCRDSRVPLSGSTTRLPSAVLRSSTNTVPAPNTGNLAKVFGGANSVTVYDVPVVLGPPVSSTNRWMVLVNHLDLAATMTVHFAWREVPISPGEVGPF